MESTPAMPVCTSKQGKWLTHTHTPSSGSGSSALHWAGTGRRRKACSPPPGLSPGPRCERRQQASADSRRRQGRGGRQPGGGAAAVTTQQRRGSPAHLLTSPLLFLWTYLSARSCTSVGTCGQTCNHNAPRLHLHP